MTYLIVVCNPVCSDQAVPVLVLIRYRACRWLHRGYACRLHPPGRFQEMGALKPQQAMRFVHD